MQRQSCPILLGTLLLGSLVSVWSAATREKVSLDGVWSFATDPNNRGEAEEWYRPETMPPKMPLPGYGPTANGGIRVPGIWDNQGYGTETDKVRHHFAGKGWYQRQVQIPQSWAGRREFLIITGINRYGKVWIGGQYLGEHIGCLSVQEYDLTSYTAPGETVTITIQVDSKQRWEVDALYGASALADYMEVAWGGIWGHVFLEARNHCWLSDLFVQPDLANSSCSASATLNGKAHLPDTAKFEVFDRSGRRVAETLLKLDPRSDAGQPITVNASIPGAELWTPNRPTLYQARLSLLKANEVLDAVETRFGMRQFTADGFRLLLNGQPIMLCGYGDDHIYPEAMAMPGDKELHLRQLRLIKSYGFNHVRHHSTMMPPEYYEACDEVGMITTAEFPICYYIFLPGVGPKWLESVPPGTDPGPALATYRREWTASIKQNRNHPSILCWVMGNELGQYDDLPKPRSIFAEIARQYDPQRFFIDSDGAAFSVLDPKNDRDTLGLYLIQFDEGSDPVNNSAKYQTPPPIKPTLSHETGNYVTFSRPDLIDQFQHNIKPFWLAAGKAKLERLGLLGEAGRWAEISERLYALLHKHNLESLRKNPYLSGYHYWLFQDYWTTSNGIVDHYFRRKSITPEEVLKFNNEVVLLQEGLQRTYRGKNRLELKLLVSNFSDEPLRGDLRCEVKVGEVSVARQQRTPLNAAPQGKLVEVMPVGVELPEVASPARLKITMEVAAIGKCFANDWSSWLYPAVIRPASSPVPIFAEAMYARQFPGWDVQPILSKCDLSRRAVYLTSWPPDPRMVDAMVEGASVVVLEGVEQLMKSCALTFRTSWWRAGEKPWDEKNHTGTFVYDHPATRVMAPDGWCDDGWFHLIEGSRKCDLESAPARPQVIIRALPGMLAVKDEALLFEVGVGKGSLIVSGLNHRRAKGRPENEWLIARLLDYAAGFPQPKSQWPATFLAVVSVAPEGCLPGFRRLVANQGEEDTWYSYREDNVRVFICRQTQPGNLVTWETAPVPKNPSSDRVTFVFAGGLGFSSEPKTEGFVLEINGKETLRFDMPAPARWESADKRVELRFDLRRTHSVDQLGLFYLTVPRDLLEAGAPCQLGVRSLGTGSRRWFGLNLDF